MRTAVVGGMAIVGVAIAALMAATLSDAVFAQQRSTPHGFGSSGALVTQTAAIGDNCQLVTIIDPEMHVMSVYHVEPSGEIVLKSVRNFHYDMQMIEFNSAKPSPQEIRSLLEQR